LAGCDPVTEPAASWTIGPVGSTVDCVVPQPDGPKIVVSLAFGCLYCRCGRFSLWLVAGSES
jgi:hypothetical protein